MTLHAITTRLQDPFQPRSHLSTLSDCTDIIVTKFTLRPQEGEFSAGHFIYAYIPVLIANYTTNIITHL